MKASQQKITSDAMLLHENAAWERIMELIPEEIAAEMLALSPGEIGQFAELANEVKALDRLRGRIVFHVKQQLETA